MNHHRVRALGSCTLLLALLAAVGCEGALNLPPPNQPPRIEAFHATPSNGVAPLEVEFTGAAVDPEGGVVSYRLDFGDRTPVVLTPNAMHEYAGQGQYTAVLTVLDPQGALAVATVAITTGGRVTFSGDVFPLFTSSGCASSSCHSTATMAGGLGLEGTPSEVYPAVSSRVDLVTPCASLMLEKPARADCAGGDVFHVGGQLWPVDSAPYTTVLAWIEQGAMND